MQAPMYMTGQVEDELLVLEFERQLRNLRDEAEQRDAYRRAFERLRSHVAIYPAEASEPVRCASSMIFRVTTRGR